MKSTTQGQRRAGIGSSRERRATGTILRSPQGEGCSSGRKIGPILGATFGAGVAGSSVRSVASASGRASTGSRTIARGCAFGGRGRAVWGSLAVGAGFARGGGRGGFVGMLGAGRVGSGGRFGDSRRIACGSGSASNSKCSVSLSVASNSSITARIDSGRACGSFSSMRITIATSCGGVG